METYAGLRKISKIMGWKSPQTVLRNYEWHDFPIIRRNLANGRWCWITNSELVTQWLKRQWKPHVLGKVPRRHYETCYRCGATILAPGQSRYARTSRTIQRITSKD